MSILYNFRVKEEGLTINLINGKGLLCYKITIMSEVTLYEVIGINAKDGWYLLKEIK